jgi:hypothetical protein
MSGVCTIVRSFILLNVEEFSAQFRATDIRNHGDSHVRSGQQLCDPNALTVGWLDSWTCNYCTAGESTPALRNLITMMFTLGTNSPYNLDACLQDYKALATTCVRVW